MNALLIALLAAAPISAEEACRPDGTQREVGADTRTDWQSCKYSGYCMATTPYYDARTGEWVNPGQFLYSDNCDGRQWVYYETPVYEDNCGSRSRGSEREVRRDPCM